MAPAAGADSPAEHPLEPPDRTSPRATLTTFFESIDRAWDLYSAGNTSFEEPFLEARDCLDLSEIPPLVFQEVSAETALLLKDVLDRLELPPEESIPDAAAIAESGITTWTLPHTEIRLVLQADGEKKGQWLFSADTVANADLFYQKVRHLDYQPGRKGGHVEELRSGTRAVVLIKLMDIMPPWFQAEVGGLLVWQWFGLSVLVALLTLLVTALAWIGKRWRKSHLYGNQFAVFILPIALMLVPLTGRFILGRIFQLPGAPALVLRLVFSVFGYVGLAWLSAVVITKIGELVIRFGFRDARPLKKQLIRVVFRVASIVVVTAISLKALQLLGVPVAGLIAGLGVGGLAIALAAQSTLENFIGGIILYADQPVRVGDVCKFGSKRGTVEDVGLRSVKIRTLDRTMMTVPNADFAKMQLENLSHRDLVLFREEIHLRYETSRAQISEVLENIEAMLQADDRITDDRLRVRLTGFGDSSLVIEVFAYARTDSWPEFLGIRQDLLIRIMEIIENAGTRLALPTEIHYAAEQPAENGSRA
jgi:MscS family membrane protein